MNDLWTSVVSCRVRRQMVWQTHPMYRYHAQSCPSTSLQHWTARPATAFSLSCTNINNLTTVYRYTSTVQVKYYRIHTTNMKLREVFSFVTRLKTLKKSQFLTLHPYILKSCMKSLVQILYFHHISFFHLFNGLITFLTDELEIELW